ncbi:MAG: DUF1987 domain-containing protein [Bacteroides sp.]|nr:DUF1987 domain-containing protein [Bacteroides sp.]
MKKKAPVLRDLMIAATPASFGVEFRINEGLLRFSGNSYPENAVDFFQPLLNWVRDYVRNTRQQTLVEFRINYFNTSSSKYLFQIMEIMNAFRQKGNPVEVVWISNAENDEMLETWREIMIELELEYTLKDH